MTPTLKYLITFCELIETAFETKEEFELVRVMTEDCEDETAQALRKKARIAVPTLLGCNLITNKQSAWDAFNAYAKMNKKHFYWTLIAELYHHE